MTTLWMVTETERAMLLEGRMMYALMAAEDEARGAHHRAGSVAARQRRNDVAERPAEGRIHWRPSSAGRAAR